MTHLYGPAVRCKPKVKKWRGLVLGICIRPLHGAFVLLAIMDIRAHPISFSERPFRGRLGHQITGTTARPFLHLLNSTRRPRQVAVHSSVASWISLGIPSAGLTR